MKQQVKSRVERWKKRWYKPLDRITVEERQKRRKKKRRQMAFEIWGNEQYKKVSQELG